MAQPHLCAQWRASAPPLVLNRTTARVANGIVRVGDWVRELPAPHHIQPCACVLCRDQTDLERMVQVQAIGERAGTLYLVLDEDYECPADEVERVPASGESAASPPLSA
jgi:hypothetical protein